MKRILFMGDSITDANRNREVDFAMGHGYACLVSSRLGFENPNEYQFINRGISGNRISDLIARIKSDAINLKPDVMSILIGINDVWHENAFKNGVDEALFEELYSLYIREIKTALPEIRIMILEPFVLPGKATEENWDFFKKETALRAAAAKRVANKFGLEFIPLQEKINEATKLAEPTFWLVDGIHPSSAGHELIAREWLKCYNKQ